MIFWCPSCGVVWAASEEEPPICRHMVIYGPPARVMEPLPAWHPFAEELV